MVVMEEEDGAGEAPVPAAAAAAAAATAAASSSTGGDDGTTTPEERAFLSWLLENGARFEKIQWPSTETESGMRGAVAVADIASGEVMLEIPARLMLAPPHALADPEIGHICRDCGHVLRRDLLLAFYVMHERTKGDASFYAPFFRMLVTPDPALEWDEEDLAQLQDHNFVRSTQQRAKVLWNIYYTTFNTLHQLYPEEVDLNRYTLEEFKFAWYTILARAFGRRLPWTALVPFADCLNHANVQTKYDYNIDGNGLFRLFPTGTNAYPRGVEVFNSYGRRANDNLLLEYGFAMLDNEHDRVCLSLSVSREDRDYRDKLSLLLRHKLTSTKLFNVGRHALNLDLLKYFRISALTHDETVSELARVRRGDAAIAAAAADNAADNAAVADGSVTEQAIAIEAYECADFEAPRSWTNEAQAIERAINVLRAVQEKNFSSTLEEDEALLGAHDEPLSWRRQCALWYRVTRKRIVRDQLQLLVDLQKLVEAQAAGVLRSTPDASAVDPRLQPYFALHAALEDPLPEAIAVEQHEGANDDSGTDNSDDDEGEEEEEEKERDSECKEAHNNTDDEDDGSRNVSKETDPGPVTIVDVTSGMDPNGNKICDETCRVEVAPLRRTFEFSLTMEEDALAPLFSGSEWAGTLIWPAAVEMGAYLCETYADSPGQLAQCNVVELGAGVGLPANIAAALGAPRVVATERGSILGLLRQNAEANFPSSCDARLVAIELDWTEAGHVDTVLAEYSTDATQNLVLCCDCVYEPLYGKSWRDLLRVMARLQSHDDSSRATTSFLFSFERRTDDGIDDFLGTAARDNGLAVERLRSHGVIELYKLSTV